MANGIAQCWGWVANDVAASRRVKQMNRLGKQRGALESVLSKVHRIFSNEKRAPAWNPKANHL